MHAIATSKHPTLAVIEGACVGGGLEIATVCDMRICGSSSRFGVPVNKLGLVMSYGELGGLVDLVGGATALEIVLNRDDGHVVKMGVVRTSGVTAFDIAALDSVQRASPFGKPPSAIVSPDGNVYFHWEFHRDPIYACSTMNARPFLLNVPAPTEPAPTKPGPSILPGGDPRERNSPNAPALPSREGMFWSPSLAHSLDERT